MEEPDNAGAGNRALFTVARAANGDGVVRITGELDGEGLDELPALVGAAGRGAADVVRLDLADVEFMSSSGLRALVQAGQAAEAEGRRLHVVSASHIVTRLLEVTTLDEYFGLGRNEAGP
jgi:anti-sigma B factor antagonist